MTKASFYAMLDEIVELDPGTIQGHELLFDLEGWDSLSVVGFIAAVDKKLGLPVSPAKLVSATSVADLLELVATGIEE